MSKLKAFAEDKKKCGLTLYQTTKFGACLIESICRQQNKCDSKTALVRVENIVGNGEKMLVTSILSFSYNVFKRHFTQG